MAEHYPLLLLAAFFLLILMQPLRVLSVSFSFPPFDGKAKDLLIFQGSSNFAIANSSIKLSSRSPSQNSTGVRVLYSQPIFISTSSSFSSAFSFSVSEHVHSQGDFLAFVFIPSQGKASAVSAISSPLLSLELYNRPDLLNASSKSVSEIKSAVQKGGKISGRVEYNGMNKILTASLSNSSTGTPLLRFPQVSFHLSGPNSEVYIGFDVASQNFKLYMWEFYSWKPSVHSMPFDPAASTTATIQNKENKGGIMRSTIIAFVGAICVSLVMMITWTIVQTAFGRSKGKITMHPILCSYGEANTEETKALFPLSLQKEQHH